MLTAVLEELKKPASIAMAIIMVIGGVATAVVLNKTKIAKK